MKKILLSAAIVAVAAVAIIAAVFLVRRAAAIHYSDSLGGPVADKVVLERDISGVPLIRAGSMEDACFGMGYLHAQDRFSLMEYWRALANGRAGEVAGEDGSVIDRLCRALRFRERAGELLPRLRDPHGDYLDAYVRGINTARARLLLEGALERNWDAEDVIAVLLLREWTGAFLNNGELLFSVPRTTTVTGLKEIIPEELLHSFGEKEWDGINAARRIRAVLRKNVGSFNRGYAFFIPPSRVKEGRRITAFSFEDPLSVYPGWYPVHIRVGELLIRGITHTGFPFIFAGDNGSIAFHGFAAALDAQDLVSLSVDPSGDSYQLPGGGGWRRFEMIGEGSDAIRLTDYGPVINDIAGAGPRGSVVIAARSPSIDETYIDSLFAIPLASSIEEATERAGRVASLPRVYLFAAEESAVRIWSGMIPLRGVTDAVFRSGPDAVWRGMADLSLYADRFAGVHAAGSAFLSDAPPALRGLGLPEGERHGRLIQMLARRRAFTTSSVESVLTDRYSVLAREFIPLFLSIMDDNPLASVRLTRIYFQNWRWSMGEEFISPSIYHMLLQSFMLETFGDELKRGTPYVMEEYRHIAPRFLELARENTSPLFDDGTTYTPEGRDATFDRAFLKAMRFFNRARGPAMSDWEWGAFHAGHFAVPAPSGEMLRDTLDDEPFPGSNDTLQLGTAGLDLRPLVVTSLSGFISREESLLQMYFSYSTHHRSKFYYGSEKRPGTTSFHRVFGVYFTEITPRR
ncbi:MAG: penicillin acylase family protein [Spirochaetes bacterium]|nr:penicillin acylase family protein [Spirochaetota bacterium]